MLKTFSLSDIGKMRTMNQDSVYTTETPIGPLPNLFILADGMGGYNGGGFASSYTVEIVKEVAANSLDTTPRRIFEAAITAANAAVRKKAHESTELEKMGTTLVLATVVGDILHVANVGDSRLYIAGNDIRQITVDHSYVEEMIKIGSLDRASARTHPQKNIITRAIGASDNIEPDFFTVRLRPGEVVLMCSDGLSNMVEDDDILTILKKERDLCSKVDKLIKAANDNGGRDNISVIVADPFCE